MATKPAYSCPSCRAPLAAEARFCGACGRTIIPGAAAPEGLDGLVGQVIAERYRVVAKLGAGGMGTVFRAEQVSVRRAIALKVLDPAVTQNNPELVRRFQAEAEVVARLSHPHTVTLFDFGHAAGGLLYIAMELVDGRGLRDVIAREAPLAPYRAVDIAAQIASSLADAHSHGIVHRDLKPDNVILSERAGRRDFARVLDFGIAKLFDDGAHTPAPAMTRAGQILGTPQYMAPEQVTGGAVDGRTDIYALGAILYEMLTGRPPFMSDSLIGLLSAHMHDPPPPLGVARPGLTVPMPLERLLFASLAKEPAARPADMRTVEIELGDLRSLLDPGPRRSSSGGGAAMPPLPTPYPGSPGGAQLTPMPPPLPPPMPVRSAPAFTPPPPPLPLHGQAMNTPLPAPRRPARWPWLVVALLVLGGGTAGTIYAVRRAGVDAPATPSSPSSPSAPPAPSGPGETFRSSRLGYSVALPPGLSAREDPATGSVLASGSFDGNLISIAVNPVGGWEDAESRATQIEQATGGKARITDRRTRRIRDVEHVSIVYEDPSIGSRFETVFYPGATPMAVTFAAQSGYFDETAALRDSLFRDRFQPGGS